MPQDFLPPFCSPHRTCTGSGPPRSPAVWLVPILAQNLTLSPFSPHSVFLGRGGGNFQSRKEKDNEDPQVLSFAQALPPCILGQHRKLHKTLQPSTPKEWREGSCPATIFPPCWGWKGKGVSMSSPGGITWPASGLWILAAPLDSSMSFFSFTLGRSGCFSTWRSKSNSFFLCPFPAWTD